MKVESLERVYHPYDKWEDYEAGFYNNASASEKSLMIEKVVELFTNPENTRKYMNKVIREWFYSCEQNLSNSAMNKIAYLGQGACCLYAGVPSTVTMEAWSSVPEENQVEANNIAIEVLSKWEKIYRGAMLQKSQDNKC
jgi:hypothetical protein